MRRSCCHEACFLFCLVAALGYCTALLRAPVRRGSTTSNRENLPAMEVFRAQACWEKAPSDARARESERQPAWARLERPRAGVARWDAAWEAVRWGAFGEAARSGACWGRAPAPRLRATRPGLVRAPVEAVRSAPVAALPGCAFARASPRPDPAASARCDPTSQPDPAARAPPRPDLAAARRQSGSHRLVAFGLQHICAAGSFACLSRLAKSLAVSWSPDEIMERWRVI